jgi:Na+/H+-dicarboxylate symporter/ABC-type amino acid transport substrate-binding protein
VSKILLKKSLGYQAVVAIILGIFSGLFLGPINSIFKPAADVFSMLLQMVVLPYISFSLIHGLGSLAPAVAKRLLKRGWVFFVVLWVIILAAVHLLILMLPQPVQHFIGYTTPQAKTFLQQFIGYLVPANPIYDFANNILPAITVFGLIVGIALMHIEKKQPLLGVVERANRVMEKILEWIAVISPIGIFAHLSVAVGTVNFQDLFKLELYVFGLIFACLFFTFWTLPALISSLTPMRYKEIIDDYRFVCLLAFATGLPSIAFPFITKCVKKTAIKYHLEEEGFHSTSQTIVPLGFTFAQLGNSMILFFVMFLSFYYRHPFEFAEKVLLNFLAIPMSFGSSFVSVDAVQFLITHLNLPSQAFSLFVETLSVTLNFQVLLSVASIFTFIVLVLFAYRGKLRVNMRKLLLHFFLSFGVFAAIVLLAKGTVKIQDKYASLYQQLNMKEALQNYIPKFPKATFVNPVARPEQADLTPLARILKNGAVRVAYDPESIPFGYYNGKKELVGYDIAFAYALAHDLDCTLEFVPLKIQQMAEGLNNASFDICMAAILMTEDRLLSIDFPESYAEEFNVLVVPTSKQKLFLKYSPLDPAFKTLNLSVGGLGAYARVAERHFPYAKHKGIEVLEQFTKGEIDGMIWSRIHAFAWCLSHPEFIALGYDYTLGKLYFSYPVQKGSYNTIAFLNHWLDLKKQSGFTDEQRAYWMSGDSPASKEARWSIMRNVFHWIN